MYSCLCPASLFPVCINSETRWTRGKLTGQSMCNILCESFHFIFMLYVVLISLSLLNRCNEVVETYIQDTDPDSLLNIGADMRKIQMCYKILKVSSFSAKDEILCNANLRTVCERIFLCYHGHWPGG